MRLSRHENRLILNFLNKIESWALNRNYKFNRWDYVSEALRIQYRIERSLTHLRIKPNNSNQPSYQYGCTLVPIENTTDRRFVTCPWCCSDD